MSVMLGQTFNCIISFLIERCSRRHLGARTAIAAEETKYRSTEMLQEFLIRLGGEYSGPAADSIPPLKGLFSHRIS